MFNNELAGNKLLYIKDGSLIDRKNIDPHFFDVNDTSIYDFLLFGSVLPPNSPFKGVDLLLPGQNDSQVNSWNNLNLGKEVKSINYLVDELDLFLQEYFYKKKIDGILLSGGIDSAIILSYLDKNTKCFTFGGRRKDFDDVYYAKVIASHFGFRNHFFFYPDFHKDFDLYKRSVKDLKVPLLFFNSVPFLRMSESAELLGVKSWTMGQNADTLSMSYPAPFIVYQRMKLSNYFFNFLFKIVSLIIRRRVSFC